MRTSALLNNASLTESVNGKGSFVTTPTWSPRLGPPGVMHQMRELGHETTGALLNFDSRPVVFADTHFVGKLMRYRVTAKR